MVLTPGRFHRVPIGFGPAPSPRQGPDGQPFTTWKTESEMHLTGTVFNVTRESVQSLLPPGYTVDPACEQPTILFECMNLRNLPWLAGRGYNTWGIYASNVICEREGIEEDLMGVAASYMMVLFESFCDPIVTGREELGFSKLWAELPDPITTPEGTLVHTASWLGTEFLRLEVPKITSHFPDGAASLKQRPYTVPSIEGFYHHRYVPAVGHPGKHDASYATYMPGMGVGGKPTVLKSSTSNAPLGETKLIITPRSFEELPTLWNVVEGLQSLKLSEVREVYHEVILGAGDCSSNRRIEW